MTKDKALKLALEALDIVKIHYTQNRHVNEAITAIKEALAQPEQNATAFIAAEDKKVASRYGYVPKLHPSEWMEQSLAQPEQEPGITVRIWRDENNDQNAEMQRWHTLPDGEYKLYTTPPKRTWMES